MSNLITPTETTLAHMAAGAPAAAERLKGMATRVAKLQRVLDDRNLDRQGMADARGRVTPYARIRTLAEAVDEDHREARAVFLALTGVGVIHCRDEGDAAERAAARDAHKALAQASKVLGRFPAALRRVILAQDRALADYAALDGGEGEDEATRPAQSLASLFQVDNLE